MGRKYLKGIGDDFLVLTEFKNMPADVAKAATAARDGIAKGSLNIFEGPMMDNQGNAILKSGEVLDDGGLWAMNYYVEVWKVKFLTKSAKNPNSS